MPPSVMIIGKRSISLITIWLPQTMIGIDTKRPKTTSADDSSNHNVIDENLGIALIVSIALIALIALMADLHRSKETNKAD